MLPDLLATQSPTEAAMAVPIWLDLSAVVVGSFSGLFYARDRQLDLVGYIALAILSGLGGGLVRDTIMQVGDVYLLKSKWAIIVAILAGTAGFFFPTAIDAHPRLLEWVDILSVGLFAAAGTDKAILYQLYPVPVIFMGVITGVGGGMMRDVFLGDVPHIFRRSNWYAVCAIGGSVVYYLCAVSLHVHKVWATVACVLVTVLLRRISLRYNLYSPAEIDLAPTVKRMGHTVAESAKQRGITEGEHLIERQTHERASDATTFHRNY